MAQGLKAALDALAVFRSGGLVQPWLRGRDLPPEDRALAYGLSRAVIRRLSLWQSLCRAVMKPRPSAFKQRTRDALMLIAAGMTDLPTFEPAVLIGGLVGAVKKTDYRGSRALNALARSLPDFLPSWLSQRAVTEEGRAEEAGLPLWAWSLWRRQRSAEEFDQLCRHMEEAPALSVACDVPPPGWHEALAARGLTAVPGEVPGLWRFDGMPLPSALPGYDEGALIPMTEGAALVAERVASSVPPGGRLLEICGGRGVKTARILTLRPDITVEVWDLSQNRLQVARERLEVMGVAHRAHFQWGDGRQLRPFQEPDVVFVDAPCSGSGTWSRHLEARWRTSPESVTALAETGFELACRGLNLLRPGGTLWYSTCSLFEEENEGVAARLRSQGLKTDGLGATLWPEHRWTDGFYLLAGTK